MPGSSYREDITDEQLIDVLLGNRVYTPSLTVMNKIDLVNAGFTNELTSKLPYNFVPVSAESDVNIAALKEEIYKKLDFVRIYMRRRTGETDFKEPMIVRNGSSVLEVCNKVHRNIKDEFRYALIWGKSVKFGGPEGRDQPPADGRGRTHARHEMTDTDIIGPSVLGVS